MSGWLQGGHGSVVRAPVAKTRGLGFDSLVAALTFFSSGNFYDVDGEMG